VSATQFPVGKPLSPVLNESATDNRRKRSANLLGVKHETSGQIGRSFAENQLATQTKLGDDGTVTLHIVLLDVVEHATTTTNHHEETSTTVIVFLVRLQVAREVVDALGKDGNLHFG
jgi:hypothetical protein